MKVFWNASLRSSEGKDPHIEDGAVLMEHEASYRSTSPERAATAMALLPEIS